MWGKTRGKCSGILDDLHKMFRSEANTFILGAFECGSFDECGPFDECISGDWNDTVCRLTNVPFRDAS